MIKLFYNCAIAAGQHKKFLIIFVNTDPDEAYRGLVYDFDLRKKDDRQTLAVKMKPTHYQIFVLFMSRNRRSYQSPERQAQKSTAKSQL